MSPPRVDSDTQGWQGMDGFDRTLEHRVRLAISVLLSRSDTLNFRRLRELLSETDGSLGAHLRKLEECSFITVRKKFENRKPVSWYSLTARGRQALHGHLQALERIIKNAAV